MPIRRGHKKMDENTLVAGGGIAALIAVALAYFLGRRSQSKVVVSAPEVTNHSVEATKDVEIVDKVIEPQKDAVEDKATKQHKTIADINEIEDDEERLKALSDLVNSELS